MTYSIEYTDYFDDDVLEAVLEPGCAIPLFSILSFIVTARLAPGSLLHPGIGTLAAVCLVHFPELIHHIISADADNSH